MLECYFIKPSTVDRIHESWLAPQIERYVEWLDLQGYAIRSVLSISTLSAAGHATLFATEKNRPVFEWHF